MVSLIIVNHNGQKFIGKCIDSLLQIKYPAYEIIVVDNGSTDNSKEIIKSYLIHPHFHFFPLGKNLGLSKAQNEGAKLAKGKLLFFLNNDVLVDKDIISNLVKMYEIGVGVLGCRMGNYDGTRELDSAISVDRFSYPCGRTANTFYPDGAIFISSKIFWEIGGFDEKLFLYGEDRDLCWRVWLAGYLVLMCMNAIFYHASSCVVDTNYFRRKVAERNMIRSMLKNYSFKSLLSIIPQYICLSIAEVGFLLLAFRFKAIWKSYLPAYWWNIINFQDTIRARKRVIRRVNDDYIRKIMSKHIGKLFVLKNFGIPKFTARGK